VSQARNTDDVCQYLTFFVAGEQYALDVLRVREVVGLAPITRVPSAPPDVRGVVNLRGSVIPVIDLGLRFHRRELSLTPRTCIVVVERQGGRVDDGRQRRDGGRDRGDDGSAEAGYHRAAAWRTRRSWRRHIAEAWRSAPSGWS